MMLGGPPDSFRLEEGHQKDRTQDLRVGIFNYPTLGQRGLKLNSIT